MFDVEIWFDHHAKANMMGHSTARPLVTATHFTFYRFVATKGVSDKGGSVFEVQFRQGRRFGSVVARGRSHGAHGCHAMMVASRHGLDLEHGLTARLRDAAHGTHVDDDNVMNLCGCKKIDEEESEKPSTSVKSSLVVSTTSQHGQQVLAYPSRL